MATDWSHFQAFCPIGAYFLRHYDKGGSQPYRRHRASRKAPLCKQKPWSVKGRAVTQLQEPFSEDNMMDLHNDGDSKASRDSIIDW